MMSEKIGDPYTVVKYRGGSIQITQKDIDDGEIDCEEYNPIAISLRRALGDKAVSVFVDAQNITIQWGVDDYDIEYQSDPDTRVFMNDWKGYRDDTKVNEGGPKYVTPTEIYVVFEEGSNWE